MVGHAVHCLGVAEAGKQRRKLQNRKNQRARRQRIKGRDTETDDGSRPFEVMRWRVDETDNVSSQDQDQDQDTDTDTRGVRLSYLLPFTYTSAATESAAVLTPMLPTAHLVGNETMALSRQPCDFSFPLSSDHLLHLIQYNVFRAFISIKRTLHIVLSDPTTCPVFGPCLDDTTRQPPNPNTPSCLYPTLLQLTRYHFPWINIIPFGSIRDNLIRREGHFDVWELWQDLIGEHMWLRMAAWQRDTPANFSEISQSHTSSSETYTDTDEITSGRCGLIVWGEPHDMKSWEATPSFLMKWSWAVEGCHELVENSNRRRMMRGEEPMRLPMSM